MRAMTMRGAATRARILSEAARLIHVGGVNATTVDQILEASSTGKSQFYHYFGSKETIVRAVLDGWIAENVAAIGQVLARQRPGLEELAALFDAVGETHSARGFKGGCPIASLALEIGESDPYIMAQVREFYAGFRRVIEGELTYMQGGGELPAGTDISSTADFVTSVFHGAILLSTVHKSWEPMKDAKKHMLLYLTQLVK